MAVTKKLEYNQYALTIKKHIKEYEEKIKQLNTQLNDDNNQYVALAVVTFQLEIIDLYFQQDDKYFSFFNAHNRVLLDHTRKVFGEIIFLLKTYFSIQVSSEFSKSKGYLSKLTYLNPTRILNLLSQLEFLCMRLNQKYGLSSKYIISVAYIYNDICGFALNIIDFQKYINISKDLRHEEYSSVKELLDLIEKMLDRGSSLFIDAYSNAENDKEPVRKALNLLSILKTYSRIIGHKDNIPQLERKKLSWERYLSS